MKILLVEDDLEISKLLVEIDKDNFVNLLLFQNKENTLVG